MPNRGICLASLKVNQYYSVIPKRLTYLGLSMQDLKDIFSRGPYLTLRVLTQISGMSRVIPPNGCSHVDLGCREAADVTRIAVRLEET